MMRVLRAPTVSSSAEDARVKVNAGAEVVLLKVPRKTGSPLDPGISDTAGPCGVDMALLNSCFDRALDSSEFTTSVEKATIFTVGFAATDTSYSTREVGVLESFTSASREMVVAGNGNGLGEGLERGPSGPPTTTTD